MTGDIDNHIPGVTYSGSFYGREWVVLPPGKSII